MTFDRQIPATHQGACLVPGFLGSRDDRNAEIAEIAEFFCRRSRRSPRFKSLSLEWAAMELMIRHGHVAKCARPWSFCQCVLEFRTHTLISLPGSLGSVRFAEFVQLSLLAQLNHRGRLSRGIR